MSAGHAVARAASMLIAGWLSLLFGCGPTDARSGPFELRDGVWHYESTPIADADAKTFQAAGGRYAKDARRVYYGSTYRDGRDYFTSRRSRVVVVEGADPASFTVLGGEYARDRAGVFFEGVGFPVKDVASFALLDYGFARDRVTGYYHQRPVPGSDGGTFEALDLHYSKDRSSVFHSDLEPGKDGAPPVRRTVRLEGPQAASFAVLEAGYAADAGQVYFQAKTLTRDAAGFSVLGLGYARTATHVYYAGRPVAGADPASFALLQPPTEDADSRDARRAYQQGRPARGTIRP